MAGRPRKAGARRPSGDLRFIPDDGSPNLLAHRAIALNPALAALIADDGKCLDEIVRRHDWEDKRCAYPLGILYARHQITGPQHYAGRRYLALFVRAVRGVGIPSILADLAGRGSISTFHVFSETVAQAGADIRNQYLSATEILERCGPKIVRIVFRLAVYEEGVASADDLPDLKYGLGALRDHFEESDKRKLP